MITGPYIILPGGSVAVRAAEVEEIDGDPEVWNQGTVLYDDEYPAHWVCLEHEPDEPPAPRPDYHGPAWTATVQDAPCGCRLTRDGDRVGVTWPLLRGGESRSKRKPHVTVPVQYAGLLAAAPDLRGWWDRLVAARIASRLEDRARDAGGACELKLKPRTAQRLRAVLPWETSAAVWGETRFVCLGNGAVRIETGPRRTEPPLADVQLPAGGVQVGGPARTRHEELRAAGWEQTQPGIWSRRVGERIEMQGRC